MRNFFLLLNFLLGFTNSYSQNNSDKPINIGDKMPDILLSNFIRNSAPTRLSDLEGKLVIFDLWNVWCSACIRLMPSLDTLQKKFGNKIKIILITDSKRADVEKLFANTKMKIPDLPMVVNDTAINNLFPHSTVPLQIWIDTDGRVKFITDAYNATSENIQAVLDNRTMALHVVKETNNFDSEQSLLDEGDGRLRYHLKYYSFFMNRLDEYRGGFQSIGQIDTILEVNKTKLVNVSLLQLYKFAFGPSIPDGLCDIFSKKLRDNRIILEVKDSVNFYEPFDNNKKDDWRNNNILSYESAVPIADNETPYNILQQDLNRFFPYAATVEKRKLKCYVIKKISNDDKIKTTGGPARLIIEANQVAIENYPMSTFVSLLSNMNSNSSIPIVDGTNYKNNVDISVKPNFSKLDEFSKALNIYGLEICEEVREINMLVIRDKNNSMY